MFMINVTSAIKNISQIEINQEKDSPKTAKKSKNSQSLLSDLFRY